MKGTSSVTAADVAKLAGVSRSTVSRAFTPGASISGKARDKILEAARELGYQPNAIARMLISKQTQVVGVVINSLNTNPFYATLLAYLSEELQKRNFKVMLFSMPGDSSVDELIPQVMQYKVAAIIIISSQLSSEMAQVSHQAGIPVILLNRTIRQGSTFNISSDNVQIGRLAADVLLDEGHKRLAFIGGTPDTSTHTQRWRGFSKRVKDRGGKITSFAMGDYNYSDSRTAALEVFNKEPYPTGIFCVSDIAAMATMDVARYSLGLKIPDDVSLIGVDDIEFSATPAYNLSTIRQAVPEMIDAVMSVLSGIQRGGAVKDEWKFPGVFVPRGTVTSPPVDNE